MATRAVVAGYPARERAQPVARSGYDWAIVGLCTWFVAGFYLDGWAHNHIPQVETFFTPWHGVLYSGYLAVAALLVLTFVRNRVQGYVGFHAMPVGYEQSLLGAAIFAAGGVGDLIWHQLFGIEASLETLLSPTHLALVLGAALMVSGPFRAAWQQANDPNQEWMAHLPMLLSLTFLLSSLTFITQYAHPFAWTPAAFRRLPFGPLSAIAVQTGEFEQAAGILAILLQSALLMGLLLLTVLRWALPFGSLTLVVTLNAVLMTLMRDKFLATGPVPLIAVAFVGGLAADLLRWQLKPSVPRRGAVRVFAFLVPVVLYLLYFLALVVRGGGIWWSIHVWLGAVASAGVVGWLLSYLLIPTQALRDLGAATRTDPA